MKEDKFPLPGRKKIARQKRRAAAERSTRIAHEEHLPNGDTKSPYLFNFTKGLSHGPDGLLADPQEYADFITGTEQGDPYFFSKVQLHSGKVYSVTASQFPDQKVSYRQWESPTAGHSYELQGPDPQAITMPPAPQAGSTEFAAEMAEVYTMALVRDEPAAAFMSQSLINGLSTVNLDDGALTAVTNATKKSAVTSHGKIVKHAKALNKLTWFRDKSGTNGFDLPSKNIAGRRRHGETQTVNNIFRGAGEDATETPFLSQFMVMGTSEPGTKGANRLKGRATGRIAYGAQLIDQRVRVATPKVDYMQNWASWLDVQNAVDMRPITKGEFIPGAARFMTSLRDLATYVHDDQLYQAYLNAALILLREGYAFDPGIPFHRYTMNEALGENREPFALFGAPHLLTLVTEVSSRALKAVRFQKFSVHRRLRPEAAGGLFHTVLSGYHPQNGSAQFTGGGALPEDGDGTTASARKQLERRIEPYFNSMDGNAEGVGTEPGLKAIVEQAKAKNGKDDNKDSYLLPMAFPEGSPMHPAYGAGHATVAGACVTLLKAFFNMSDPTNSGNPAFLVNPGEHALVPAPDGATLLATKVKNGLTLESELNKLMWNISNGRSIAGVHYYTDYIESALLGESITLGILAEQMITYHPGEIVSMTVPLLVPRALPETLTEGGSICKGEVVSAVRIDGDGNLHRAEVPRSQTNEKRELVSV